jgi:hypothetical protein
MFVFMTALALVALVGAMLTGTHYAVFGRDPGCVRR